MSSKVEKLVGQVGFRNAWTPGGAKARQLLATEGGLEQEGCPTAVADGRYSSHFGGGFIDHGMITDSAACTVAPSHGGKWQLPPLLLLYRRRVWTRWLPGCKRVVLTMIGA